MNLLPHPRQSSRRSGTYTVPNRAALFLPPDLHRDTELLPLAELVQEAADDNGIELELVTGPRAHPRLAIVAQRRLEKAPGPDAYSLAIGMSGVQIEFFEIGGLRAAIATLVQIMREHGRRLPLLNINDWADFKRRGVMLDISRGRVPRLETLLELVEILAGFKINELQLYTEHTFAYRHYEPIWSDWGALTGEQILRLDTRCRQLGIDLVPNQNSFGHLRYWLEYPPLKSLAEVSAPYEGTGGTFLRYPTTLAPTNPATLPFLRELYDELLPHFSSQYFNVGCDETWDLGRGQSQPACERLGKGRVYLDFLLAIQKEVAARGRRMMFWGDIILHHPELIKELPQGVIALNWGYEANHPFAQETATFAESGIPFYVCPGTSTWMTLIGRNDNAFANLRAAAESGRRNGAIGYLNTDWGDGGHPQPLAVSLPLFAFGAAQSWNGESWQESALIPVLSRDVYYDPTQKVARAALGLGIAHQRFDYLSPNVTPFGAVIAAPVPKARELFCRDGLKYYARIPGKNIRMALDEVERQRRVLYASRTLNHRGELLAAELDMAARMAVESCQIMLWQQALAAGRTHEAHRLAKRGIKALADLDHDFTTYWPHRNQGTTKRSASFLKWRQSDYRKGVLHFPPEAARVAPVKTYAAE